MNTMYCERCQRLFEGTVCPECRRDRRARPPRAEDPCFLTERGAPWDGMLADVLMQNGIPYLDHSRLGAALGMRAPLLQSVRFYVRYDDLERARALTEAVLGPEAPQRGDSTQL